MTTAIDHRLLELLRRAADGTPPEGSPGGVQVLSRPLGGPSAVLVLEGRGVVAADVAPGWVLDHLPPGFDGPDE
uniref:hypothetical protein n=1 Tax=Pseudonocardia pini TaxID=2758030 RepID=UPI0015F07299